MTSNVGLNNSICSNLEQLRQSKRPVSHFVMQKNNLPQNNHKINTRNLLGNTVGFGIGIIAPIFPLSDNFGKVTKESAADMSSSLSHMLPDADTLENTKETAQKILKDSGLENKGINIHFVNHTDENLQELKEIIDEAIPPKNKIKSRLNQNLYTIFSEGANAAYIHGKKKRTIIVPEQSLFSNVYHELGHAMNFNCNILSKALIHTRSLTPFGASIVAPIALLTSLIHKPDKSKPEKDKNIAEKTVDFIANHPVTLTALSVLPLVTEEGLASFRGLKAASKYLPKPTILKLTTNYISAWSTYGLVGASTVLGVWAGKKVADYINNDKN